MTTARMPAAPPASGLGRQAPFGYPPGMQAHSDEQLMQRYGSGEMTAFEELYARYRGPLYRYFMRQLGDEPKINDLYQGVWEKVISARGRYRPDRPFKAWLFRIAHNHLVDFYRRQKPTTQIDQAGFLATSAEQESQLEQAQRKALLDQAVQSLPEDQREAIVLRLEGDLSLDDIAALTGVGRETVKSRLRYATAKLKQAMGT